MKHAALIATLTALLVAAAAPSAPADSVAYWRSCGDQPHSGIGWYNVRAHGISCRKARAVARRYANDPTPYGFACQSRRIGFEASRQFCRRSRGGFVQKVRFTYGA